MVVQIVHRKRWWWRHAGRSHWLACSMWIKSRGRSLISNSLLSPCCSGVNHRRLSKTGISADFLSQHCHTVFSGQSCSLSVWIIQRKRLVHSPNVRPISDHAVYTAGSMASRSDKANAGRKRRATCRERVKGSRRTQVLCIDSDEAAFPILSDSRVNWADAAEWTVGF